MDAVLRLKGTLCDVLQNCHESHYVHILDMHGMTLTKRGLKHAIQMDTNYKQVPNPPCITSIGYEKTLQGFPLMQKLPVLLDPQSYCVRHPTHCKNNNSNLNKKQFFLQKKFLNPLVMHVNNLTQAKPLADPGH